jgi:protein required for attachment to host cells
MTRQTNYDPRWARHGGAYVIVADGGRARIYKRSGNRQAPQLTEIEHLERDSAHLHARDLTTDVTGRLNTTGSRVTFGPRSTMRHGAQSDYDPHAVEVERFARQLAARLLRLRQQERAEDRLEELVLIAEPRFLGVLRRELPAALRPLVTREVPRDLTGTDAQPIAQAAFALPDTRS